MRTLLALFMVVIGMTDISHESDGFPNPDMRDVAAALPGLGDLYGGGPDETGLRLIDPTTGAGLFTTNTNPAIVGIDPLTGEDAPTGTDVGFGAPLRRYVQTGVLNGDFALGPPDSSQAITDANPLPYWTWEPEAGGRHSLTWEADSSYASGYKMRVTTSDSLTVATSYLTQFVAVPMSQGKQYRVLLSSYSTAVDTGIEYRYYRADATTAVGSAVTTYFSTLTTDTKVDAGLVPATAAYVRIRIFWIDDIDASFGEVRAAFLPAEATVGLGSISDDSLSITTTERVVKSVTIPANTFVVGSVYRVTAFATVTSTVANTVNVRLRLGPGTLTGTVVTNASNAASTTASSDAAMYVVLMTVRSVGATGTVIGHMTRISGAEPFSANEVAVDDVTAAVVIDTTVANLLELTAETGAGTTTINFRQAVIECVMAS